MKNQRPYRYTKTVYPSQLHCQIKDSTVKSNTVSLHKDSASLSYTVKSKTVSLYKDSAPLSATLKNQRPYRYTKTVHPPQLHWKRTSRGAKHPKRQACKRIRNDNRSTLFFFFYQMNRFQRPSWTHYTVAKWYVNPIGRVIFALTTYEQLNCFVVDCKTLYVPACHYWFSVSRFGLAVRR